LGERGQIEPDEDVVLITTGTGFTERNVDEPAVEAQTVSMAELDGAIGDHRP
jgi:molybdopterin biosynthesis enzyme MoaB